VAKTTEPSNPCAVAIRPFCQITLATCYFAVVVPCGRLLSSPMASYSTLCIYVYVSYCIELIFGSVLTAA